MLASPEQETERQGACEKDKRQDEFDEMPTSLHGSLNTFHRILFSPYANIPPACGLSKDPLVRLYLGGKGIVLMSGILGVNHGRDARATSCRCLPPAEMGATIRIRGGYVDALNLLPANGTKK